MSDNAIIEATSNNQALFDFLLKKFGSSYLLMSIYIVKAYFCTRTFEEFNNELCERKRFSLVQSYGTDHLQDLLFYEDGRKKFDK
jgi:hypothetical protein